MTDISRDPHLPQHLASALQSDGTRHGPSSTMSPELTYGRHRGPAPVTARAATVIMLLYRRQGRWHIPLTVRAETVVRHAGQISLPGGAIDPGEKVWQAARRELEEELGRREHLEMLGELAGCYVFASNFDVAPCVAVTEDVPEWQPNPAEVVRVVEMPLEVICGQFDIATKVIRRGALVFRAPCFRIGGDEVWGATAVMLSQLADVLAGL